MNRDRILNRVPAVVATFWIIKVLATTVGETGADYLANDLHFGLSGTSYLMSAILLLALANQFRLGRYVPVSYWIVTVLMSVTGTLITDRLVDEMKVSMLSLIVVFSILLVAVFGSWYAQEKTLAMHSINTPKRELFYWVTILLTFALGTATGDYLAEVLKLGYLGAAVVYSGTIGAIAIAYNYLKLNSVLAFWLAYILTRPLGASLGDLLAQPRQNGGYGLGTISTSILFLGIIVSLIIYLSIRSSRAIATMRE